jgi:hypothetical protein
MCLVSTLQSMKFKHVFKVCCFHNQLVPLHRGRGVWLRRLRLSDAAGHGASVFPLCVIHVRSGLVRLRLRLQRAHRPGRRLRWGGTSRNQFTHSLKVSGLASLNLNLESIKSEKLVTTFASKFNLYHYTTGSSSWVSSSKPCSRACTGCSS